MNKTIKISLVTIIAFSIYFVLDDLFFRTILQFFTSTINNYSIGFVLTYLVSGTPLFAAVLILHKPKEFLISLGLSKGIVKGFLFALICTLPMLIGYAIVFDFNTEITIRKIVVGALAAAFFEELYYRGFLFGQIFRFTRIGFIPAIIIPSLIFASLHLYQSQDIATLAGIFITTFLGSAFFAWTYVEWNNNLWVPVFLHLFMNLFWMLFSAGDDALGGVYSNLFRIITIAVIITGTILYKKKKGEELEINRNTIWAKKTNQN